MSDAQAPPSKAADEPSLASPARPLPAPQPPLASPALPDPADSEEVADGRAKLVAALHGTLLMTHVNAAGKQAVAVDTLLTLVQNVLKEPEAEKYRRVRCSNESIKAKLLACKGAEDFLRAAGWAPVTREFERYLLLEAGFNRECVGKRSTGRPRRRTGPSPTAATVCCAWRSGCCRRCRRR